MRGLIDMAVHYTGTCRTCGAVYDIKADKSQRTWRILRPQLIAQCYNCESNVELTVHLGASA